MFINISMHNMSMAVSGKIGGPGRMVVASPAAAKPVDRSVFSTMTALMRAENIGPLTAPHATAGSDARPTLALGTSAPVTVVPNSVTNHEGRTIGVMGNLFRIGRKFNEGGMADIHLGERVSDGLPVVIKIFKPNSDDPKGAARFMLEGFYLTQVAHDNILATHGCFEDEAGKYLVLELLDGASLADTIGKSRFVPKTALTVITKILEALTSIHEAGLIYRDLSPNNVMILTNGDVKVIDLGICKPEDLGASFDFTRGDVVVGNPYYMSPEQARRLQLDARSDIYSFGVVLYEMLTGKPPFVHDDPYNVAMMHVSQVPASLVAVNPFVSTELDRYVTQRLLAKQPDQRPPSAEQVIMDLHTMDEEGKLQATIRVPTPPKGVQSARIEPSEPEAGIGGWFKRKFGK